MISRNLAAALVDFASTLVSDYAAVEALDRLMVAAARELAVDGAGIMVVDEDGDLRFVAASDDDVRLIEKFQVETGEGPCILAARSGKDVTTDDLRDGDERFPNFSQRASAAGLVSVHSFPMQVEGTSVGAMNLYRVRPGRLDDDERETGHVFADMASAYLITARRADAATRMVQRIRAAMDRNAPIEQAKGYLRMELDISPEQAFELMRRYARSRNAKVLDIAGDVLSGALTVGTLMEAVAS